ncbi:acyl-CoA/acyl-ACP dehydrogenase [Nocardia sp. NBC_00565]|uniref:acyl-CoA dehydrogenase family protein n=1 Tax=Nocardia sp. NBC_00565 TaxID=2975993 RepID=UPI002E824293|nr:acyl-CoA dehydrogenase family protein [Nocardia sp. NBC_00565]WUC05818.1 acyl-CoA/acyl-ACP dehydrogenase [Nocardia sp. NBC_00565]
MTLTSTQEHDELRATVRRFLTEKSPSAAVRHWMESDQGHDPAVWRQLAEQLGLHGLALPEEYGGAGGGAVELGIVLEEMGRVLLPSPYFATVALAGQAIAACGDETAKARWLPAIADGSLTATLAVAESSGSWQLSDITTAATRDGDGWTLSGTKMFVVDGHTADLLLIVARTDAGPGLFAVDGDASGVTRVQLETLDPTRRLARIDLTGAPAQRVGPDGDASAYLRTVLDLVVVALAAEQVGGAQACLDTAVEYAKIRVQFDRPIGSFQAIKHKCADMLLQIESARSAVYHAASVAAEGADSLPVAAALAAAYCANAFTNAAKENIQIHGGIGYTWEHDAHLYLKRAKSSEQLFGGPATHRARLAGLVGI